MSMSHPWVALHESPRHERYERRIQRLWEMKRSNEEEKVSLLFVRSNVSHEVGTQQEGEIHRWEHGWKRCDRKKKASIGSTRARIIVTTAYFGRIITVRVESFRGGYCTYFYMDVLNQDAHGMRIHP